MKEGATMTSLTPDLTIVVARLEKLERELLVAKRRNRWLLVAVGLGVAGVALAWALASTTPTAQAQGEKVIRANQFILEDETGKPRAVLSVEQDGAALQMRDENHTLRMALGLSKVGPGLYLSDETGKLRAGLAIGESGPMLQMYDRTGKMMWSRP